MQSRMGMSDFLERYGEQLRRARQRQRQRGRRLRAFARTSTRHTAAVALGAVALFAAVLTVAFTKSTTLRPAGAPGDVFNAKAPENEATENGTIPDVIRDLQVSSGQDVSVAQ